MTDTLQPGSPAPQFDLPTDGGGRVRLADLKGRNVVLFLYPKDDTTGCTKEAIEFTALANEFDAEGATVIGLSKDSVKSHDRYKAKHQLKTVLASDVEGTTVEAYGSWIEKSLYGRKYMGIDRSTFLIDKDGVIRRVWRKVKVADHAAEVLKALREVNAG